MNKKSLLSILVIFICAIALRINLLEIPLERDEGEYAYMGQLIANGIMPYDHEANMKLPGSYFFYYLVIKLLGDTTAQIHSALMLLSFISATTVYYFYKYKFRDNEIEAIIAAIFCLLTTSSQQLLGFALHATQISTPFLLISALYFQKAENENKNINFFYSGLLISIAVIVKQPAILVACCFCLYLAFDYLLKNQNLRESTIRLISFISGIFIPICLLIITFYFFGNWDNFKFWVYDYAITYGSELSFKQKFSLFFFRNIVVLNSHLFIWCFFLLGLIKYFNKTNLRFYLFFILGCFLYIFPGGYFRQHYYIPFAASITPLSCFALNNFFYSLRHKSIFVFTIVFLQLLLVSKYHFINKPEQILRQEYGSAPYEVAIQIANFISKNTDRNDRVLQILNEPEILFYANRRSAIKNLYFYPLGEPTKHLNKLIDEAIIDASKNSPKIIIYTENFELLRNKIANNKMIEWTKTIITNNYMIKKCYNLINKNNEFLWRDSELNCNENSIKIYLKN